MMFIKNKLKLTNLLFTISIFLSFFSIKSLPLNPAYLIGFPLIFLSLFHINFQRIKKYEVIFLIFIILFFILFSIGLISFKKLATTNTVYLSSILFLYCMLLGFSTLLLGKFLSTYDRVRIYSLISNILIINMIVDFLFRLLLSSNQGDFYAYKHSIFYTDSNFSGLVILCFLIFYLYLKENNIANIGNVRFFILTLLLMTTFSRAAILAFIVGYLFFLLPKKFMLWSSISSLFGLAAIGYQMINLYLQGESFVEIDGSFNSKFYIIMLAIDNYSSLPIVNKFFGIGMGNFSFFSNGIFAHNMMVTLVYEFGIIGISLFILYLLFSLFYTGRNLMHLLLPFFIAGFSLFSAYMPFFFVLISCIYLENSFTIKNVKMK